ncbi:flagellar protein FlaG [Pseudomonas sp. gcc21]|uniref:flagellar protein FlaG n=1 Tax=Pseudomonas sp. gcc21 TaxID=2726989 RepID=UPI001451D325|nr:flagellar protein FlaG [Pseudomonas sp. gcc21]QJD58845.1 flagellar protein FlaG [Pseudomonas sp. gcc21]
MEVGIHKPFEISRITSSAGPAEAGLSNRPASRQAGAAHHNSTVAPVEPLSQLPVEQPADAERNQLESAVTDMQQFVQSVSRDIDFTLDHESGRTVVNVTDRASGNVIRQIPSEEALRLSESLSEIRSLLFKAEA